MACVVVNVSLRTGYRLQGLAAEVAKQMAELLLLHLAQHGIEVEVIELQKEVGGDKSRKLMVVVLLIYMKQLLVLCRNNGKAVACQLLL